MCQDLDAPFIVGADTQIPQECIVLDPVPRIAADSGQHALCPSSPLPDSARSCACNLVSSVRVQRFVAPVASGLCDRQSQIQALQEQHPEQMREHCALNCCWCVCKHNSIDQTGVGSQVRLARGRTAGQHRVLPCGHSPGSRLLVFGRRLHSYNSGHEGPHQKPLRSNSDGASRNSPKHPPMGSSTLSLCNTSWATSGVRWLTMCKASAHETQ